MKEREVSTGKLGGQSLAGVEESVVHNGCATGFVGRKMFSSGPEYLSANFRVCAT
jgi:hypothetical protein